MFSIYAYPLTDAAFIRPMGAVSLEDVAPHRVRVFC